MFAKRVGLLSKQTCSLSDYFDTKAIWASELVPTPWRFCLWILHAPLEKKKAKKQQTQTPMILLSETSRYGSAAYGASKIVTVKVGKSQAAFVLILWSFR